MHFETTTRLFQDVAGHLRQLLLAQLRGVLQVLLHPARGTQLISDIDEAISCWGVELRKQSAENAFARARCT